MNPFRMIKDISRNGFAPCPATVSAAGLPGTPLRAARLLKAVLMRGASRTQKTMAIFDGYQSVQSSRTVLDSGLRSKPPRARPRRETESAERKTIMHARINMLAGDPAMLG
jgi:hypothetical protein